MFIACYQCSAENFFLHFWVPVKVRNALKMPCDEHSVPFLWKNEQLSPLN